VSVAILSRNWADPYNVIHLGQVGRVRGITYASVLPGGPSSASFTLDIAPNASSVALAPNRWLDIQACGRIVWSGVLEDALRGSPWQITASGIGMQGKKFMAFFRPTDIQGAIHANATNFGASSLPWNTPSPAMTACNSSKTYQSLDEMLNNGPVWRVDAYGNPSNYTPPTTPDYLVNAARSPARTIDGMATQAQVAYNGSDHSNAPWYVIADNLPGRDKYGLRSVNLDLTARGPITDAQATAEGNRFLQKVGGYGASYTQPVTVLQGQLMNLGGGIVDIRGVVAGEMVRIRGSEVNHDWDAAYSTDFIIGESSYNSDAGSLTMTPWSAQRRDLQSLLTAAVAAATVATF
jgi:hypothetical protein